MTAAPAQPTYYLVHTTPTGPRYAYPMPRIPKNERGSWPSDSTVTWSVIVAGDTEAPAASFPPPGNQYREPYVPGWVVADQPAAAIVGRWEEANRERGPWTKRDQPRGEDPLVLEAFASGPAAPAADTIEHFRDCERDSCTTCSVIRAVYHQPDLSPIPRSHTVDLASWQPLPAPEDTAPDRQWHCEDRAATAIYGTHTSRLWSGYLDGFRQAVVEALYQHPWVVDAQAKHRGHFNQPVNVYETKGEVTVNIPIRWDVPVPRTRYSGEKGRGPFYSREIGHHRVELIVPDHFAAASKAAALARWDGAVQRWVRKFLPDADAQLTGCSHCRGRGWHLSPEEPATETTNAQ